MTLDTHLEPSVDRDLLRAATLRRWALTIAVGLPSAATVVFALLLTGALEREAVAQREIEALRSQLVDHRAGAVLARSEAMAEKDELLRRLLERETEEPLTAAAVARVDAPAPPRATPRRPRRPASSRRRPAPGIHIHCDPSDPLCGLD